MGFNWAGIEERMLKMCKKAFSEDSTLISITEEEIKEDIRIFYNLCCKRINYVMLDGLRTHIEKQLQDCFFDRPDDVNSLKSLATLLDSFIKRILVVTRFKAYNDIKDLTLMPLVKILNNEIHNRSGVFLGQSFPDLRVTPEQTLISNGHGQIILKYAWEIRNNTTHNSLDLDMAEIATHLRYVISFYIYIIHCYKSYLLAKDPDLSLDISIRSNEKTLSDDEIRAYNFIAYGKHSQEVKTRYIDCFILIYLFDNGSKPLIELKQSTQEFLGKIKTKISVNKAIDRLQKNGHIESVNNEYILTDNGRNLIELNRNNLAINKQNFNDDLGSILAEYKLQAHISDIEKNLISIIDNNALGILNNEDIRNDDIKGFISLIRGFGIAGEQANEIFTKIIKLCESNDILVKISLGKAIGKVTDLDQFSPSVRNMERNVYIDTNVALYLICLNDDFPAGAFYDFKIGKALFDIVRENKNLILSISTVYLDEIVFNLRRALLLTTWEESGWDKEIPTNNLFYRHYVSLKRDKSLPDDINSFTDYLKYNFDISPDDLDYSSDDLDDTILEIIKDKFNELDIKIEKNIEVTANNLNRSRRLFDNAIKEVNSNKEGLLLTNDVLMGEHLFDDVSFNRIFLSNDKSFYPYRRTFIEKYHRNDSEVWLLFSASRFVGHIDLLNSRFDTHMMTDELLALIESEDIKVKSIKLADTASKLLDIGGLTKIEKKKRLNKIKEMIFSDNGADVADNESEIKEKTHRLNEIWDKIRDDINGKMDIRKFYKMLKDEDFFNNILVIIQRKLDDKKYSFSDTLKEIENLINSNMSKLTLDSNRPTISGHE